VSWDEQWPDRDFGPVVRPYAVTGGRTEPANGEILDLVSVVVAARAQDGEDRAGLGPEHRQILDLARQPLTVADLASDTGLPLGVVRVLLADLLVQGRVNLMAQRPADQQPSVDLLREVLHGLRAL
jgi:hypothetical protein